MGFETVTLYLSYKYDNYGKIEEAEEKIRNIFKYAGEQHDPLTDQYYLRARYYNPVIGRFTQEDRYRGDGLNLYAYCDNNPINYIDSTGYSCNKTTQHGTGDKPSPDSKKKETKKELNNTRASEVNRKQALNLAKDRAGIPRSQQPSRQWTVGDDITKKGADYKNYQYSNNPTHHGRYYEYDTPQGKKVIVEHTNDIEKGLPNHAGEVPKDTNPLTYDFKNPDNRYSPIGKDTDHHIRYSE